VKNWAGLRSVQLTHDELFPVRSPRPLCGQFASPAEHADSLLHVIGYEEGWGWLKQNRLPASLTPHRDAVRYVDNRT
jgi:LysR family glycine cleavage system transcriptional activator